MTIGIRWVGGNIGWMGGSPGVADGSRSPAHSARNWSMASETRSTAVSGSYGIPICLSRSGSPVPMPSTNRPGRISSSADARHRQHDRVAGERVGRAEGDPEAGLVGVAIGAIAWAIAVVKLTPSRSK